MSTIDVYRWDPARPVFRGRLGRRIPIKRRVGNFGDLLGPLVVDAMLRRLDLDSASPECDAQLLSIGSVMHQARDGAVVWGTGVNGKKMDLSEYTATRLDLRAVRGPLTRDFLLERGFQVPEVYGDPALLLPELHPELKQEDRTRDLTVVMNFNDRGVAAGPHVLNPRKPVWQCLRTIASSRLVVGSSLHGIVVAESLGIPARAVASATESEFKYADYYRGTGRSTYRIAPTVDEAVAMGGESPPEWDAAPLIEAFPADLWR